MEEKFNQNKYIQEYKKEKYKRFVADLKNEEMAELERLLKIKGISKTQFLRESIEQLKKTTK